MKKTINFYCCISLTLLMSAISISKSYSAGFATDSHFASGLATSYAGAVTGSYDISDSLFNPTLFLPSFLQPHFQKRLKLTLHS
jgi:uncharacterized membrane protein